jgi:hypothetical protein
MVEAPPMLNILLPNLLAAFSAIVRLFQLSL